MQTITKLVSGLIMGAAFLGGVFFVFIGLMSLDNSISIAAGAAMGSAMFVFVILLMVARGFDGLNQRLDEQNKALRYMAQRAAKKDGEV